VSVYYAVSLDCPDALCQNFQNFHRCNLVGAASSEFSGTTVRPSSRGRAGRQEIRFAREGEGVEGRPPRRYAAETAELAARSGPGRPGCKSELNRGSLCAKVRLTEKIVKTREKLLVTNNNATTAHARDETGHEAKGSPGGRAAAENPSHRIRPLNRRGCSRRGNHPAAPASFPARSPRGNC